MIGGRCVAAMERYNPADFRANITNGGQMRPYTPTREEEALALAATEKLGLLFGGVDLLEDGTVCEVNSNAHLVNLKSAPALTQRPCCSGPFRRCCNERRGSVFAGGGTAQHIFRN